jgi:phospholipase/lecithinase/hemolysin
MKFVKARNIVLHLTLCALPFFSNTMLSGQTGDSLPPGGVSLQVVSFGDSLSDVGTYSPFASEKFGGGRFTTNPGMIWTQLVAQYYGDNLEPAFVGGFGQPLGPAGGLAFGQGGSRVTLQPGVGHAPAGTPNADFAAATTIPVAQQVDEYLSMYGSFQPQQIVFIQGGANDLLVNLQEAQSNPADLPKAIVAINKSAVDLANLVAEIVNKGAKHIVLVNLADFGVAPEGMLTPGSGPIITEVIKTFNDTLRATLFLKGVLNKVIYIDEFTFMDQLVANFQSNGFTVSNTGFACNAQAEIAIATQLGLSNPSQFSDSLFCSPQTLVGPNADQTFMFADNIHPTTHYSSLFAQFVEKQIAASGLGR